MGFSWGSRGAVSRTSAPTQRKDLNVGLGYLGLRETARLGGVADGWSGNWDCNLAAASSTESSERRAERKAFPDAVGGFVTYHVTTSGAGEVAAFA